MNISEFFRITPDNIVQCVNYIVTLKTLKSVKYLDEGYDDPDNFDLTFVFCCSLSPRGFREHIRIW